MNTNIVLGLDLSLTQTGWAVDGADVHRQWGVIKPKSKGAERLLFIDRQIHELVAMYKPSLAVIENYAFGKSQGMAGIAEAGGVVRLALYRCGIKYIEISPMAMKKFVTGRGNCEKSEIMMHCLKNWKVEIANNNAADAFGLCQFGMCYLGEAEFLKRQEDVVAKYRKDHEV